MTVDASYTEKSPPALEVFVAGVIAFAIVEVLNSPFVLESRLLFGYGQLLEAVIRMLPEVPAYGIDFVDLVILTLEYSITALLVYGVLEIFRLLFYISISKVRKSSMLGK